MLTTVPDQLTAVARPINYIDDWLFVFTFDYTLYLMIEIFASFYQVEAYSLDIFLVIENV